MLSFSLLTFNFFKILKNKKYFTKLEADIEVSRLNQTKILTANNTYGHLSARYSVYCKMPRGDPRRLDILEENILEVLLTHHLDFFLS
jgi:hypothetical protein